MPLVTEDTPGRQLRCMRRSTARAALKRAPCCESPVAGGPDPQKLL